MDGPSIGRKMMRLRKQLDLTTTELGKMAGISQAQISRLENGHQGFRSKTLTKIAKALEVHPVYFFIEDDVGRTGVMSEAMAVYAAVAHPQLSKALRSPHFLSISEKLAVLYFDDTHAFREISNATQLSTSRIIQG